MKKTVKIALLSLSMLVVGISGDLWLILGGSTAVHGGWLMACFGGLLLAQAFGIVGMAAIAVGWLLEILAQQRSESNLKTTSSPVIIKYDEK